MPEGVTDEQRREITRRWSRDGGMGNERSAEDYTDAGCRILAEHAFRDVPALLSENAALRARVDELTAAVEKDDD